MAKSKRPNKTGAPAARAATAVARDDRMTSAQLVIWVCLHLLVIVVPIATSNLTWLPGQRFPLTFDQFDIVKVFFQRGFTLIALGAWFWHIFVEGGKIRRTKIDWLIGVVLAWFVVTTVFSIHVPTAIFGKYRRFEGLLTFFTYAGMFFVGTQILDRASRIRSLARSLFFSGSFVAIYGFAQFVGYDPVRWGNLPFEANRSFSTYGNPDLLGGFLIFPLAIALGLALSEEDSVWRGIYWTGFGFTVISWVTAFTRGAWIGGTIALLVLAFCAFRQSVRFREVDWTFTGLFGVAVTAVVIRSLSATTSVMNVSKRVQSIFNFEDASSRTRFEIWQAAWDAIKDRPITGFGLDTFRLVFPRYKPIEYVADAGYLSVADNVHNYPLQLAAAVGIPGLLLLYGLFITVAVLSAPIVFAKQAKPDRLVLASFWAAAAGYLLALSFGISVTGSSFLLWLSMAVVLSPLATTREVKTHSWGVAVAGVGIVLVAALSIGNVVYIVADNHYLKSRLMPRERGDERIAEAERAVALNPWNDMYRAEIGLANVDMVVAYYTAAGTSQDVAERASMAAQALRYFAKAEASLLDTIDFVPWEYDNYVFTTNLYTLGAELHRLRDDPGSVDLMYDRAIVIGRKGVEAEPYGPAIRFQLARALIEKDQLDEALEHMEFAVEMDPKYVDGLILLGDIYRALDRLQDAVDTYKRAEARIAKTGGSRPSLSESIRTLEQSLGGGDGAGGQTGTADGSVESSRSSAETTSGEK